MVMKGLFFRFPSSRIIFQLTEGNHHELISLCTCYYSALDIDLSERFSLKAKLLSYFYVHTNRSIIMVNKNRFYLLARIWEVKPISLRYGRVDYGAPTDTLLKQPVYTPKNLPTRNANVLFCLEKLDFFSEKSS